MKRPCSVRSAGNNRVARVLLAAMVGLLAVAAAQTGHTAAAIRMAQGWVKPSIPGSTGNLHIGPLGLGLYQQKVKEPPLAAGVLAGLQHQPATLAKGRLPIGLLRVLDSAVVVDRNTASAGAWQVVSNGWRIYSVEVSSPGALGLRLHLEALALPRGARLLVYDPADPARVSAPVLPEQLRPGRELWLETVFAERVVLECQVPPQADTSEVSFALTGLSHLYRLPSPLASPLARAGACNNDVSCYPAWAHQAAGVAELSFVDGGTEYLCTGCLLSNGMTNQTADYFLTAHHCIPDQDVADTLEWFWFYQTPTCHGSAPSMNNVPHTVGGGDLLATSPASDFAFLAMRQAPPAGVYYLGWSLQAPLASETLTLIHHPSGDYKRISFGQEANLDSNFRWVQWFSGVSEPGSSGGPLFNANHQVIGQLWGGSSSCKNPGGLDRFGRFNVTYRYIARWIDPLYALRGTYRGLFEPTNHFVSQAMGAVTLTLTPLGGFSGRLQTGSGSYSLRGTFGATGDVEVPAHGAGTNELKLSLHLDLGNGTERITGTVTGEGWSAGLLADRAVFAGSGGPAPQAGRYTLAFPGKSGSVLEPAGTSYATVRVTPAGRVELLAMLADGSRVTQSSAVSKYSQWPLFIPLNRGQGFVQSWVTFTNRSGSDLSGTVSWVRQPGGTGGYTNGFGFPTPLLGSTYERPKAGQSALGFGLLALVLDWGSPEQSLTNEFTLGSHYKLSVPAQQLRLSLNPATGLFRGSLVAPSGVEPLVFGGVVLTRQEQGQGWFLEGGLSGRISLEPAP